MQVSNAVDVVGAYQLNSTQRACTDAGVNTSMSASIQHNYTRNYSSFVTCTDLSPIIYLDSVGDSA